MKHVFGQHASWYAPYEGGPEHWYCERCHKRFVTYGDKPVTNEDCEDDEDA